uniref:Uncharacterized protein n=1 Tax=Anguilla anguilla TaxID=7936 RepID=A0A0E9XFK4_ANGAN
MSRSRRRMEGHRHFLQAQLYIIKLRISTTTRLCLMSSLTAPLWLKITNLAPLFSL